MDDEIGENHVEALMTLLSLAREITSRSATALRLLVSIISSRGKIQKHFLDYSTSHGRALSIMLATVISGAERSSKTSTLLLPYSWTDSITRGIATSIDEGAKHATVASCVSLAFIRHLDSDSLNAFATSSITTLHKASASKKAKSVAKLFSRACLLAVLRTAIGKYEQMVCHAITLTLPNRH